MADSGPSGIPCFNEWLSTLPARFRQHPAERDRLRRKEQRRHSRCLAEGQSGKRGAEQDAIVAMVRREQLPALTCPCLLKASRAAAVIEVLSNEGSPRQRMGVVNHHLGRVDHAIAAVLPSTAQLPIFRRRRSKRLVEPAELA